MNKKETKSIVLIGGGGHCLSVLDSIKENDCYKEYYITDPNLRPGEMINGALVYGSDNNLEPLYKKGVRFAFITIGSIKVTTIRKEVANKAERIGFEFPCVIDNSSTVSGDAIISKGVFIGKKAVINTKAVIGEHAIINSGAIVEHGCQVGNYSHVAIGAIICGNCEIANDVFIGANATVIQGVKIGANCIIGAGSIILADVPENTRVYGKWK